MTRRLVPFACLWLVLALAAPVVPHAQDQAQDTPQQTPTFRSRIDSVSVDVIVTDRQGNPVTDLTPEDFEIRERGRPQAIETFKLVRTAYLPGEPVPPEILSTDEHTRQTSDEANRLFVIFLDDYHVRLGNSFSVREKVAQFLSQLSPRDLVAIVTPLSQFSATTFTRNHDASAGIVMGFRGRKFDYTPRHPLEEQYAGEPPAVQERFRNDMVISALGRLCEWLGTLRDGRKTILFVSEGLTGTLPQGVQTTDALYGGQRTAGPANDSQAYFQEAMVMGDLDRVFRVASRANAAIYTLDARGLATSDFGINDNVTQMQGQQALSRTMDTMRVIAEETDGRAIVGRNDPLPALRQMVRDSGTYYLVSYTSSFAPRDGKFHEIEVRVRRRNVDVRARKGYWAISPDSIERAAAVAVNRPTAEVTEALDALAESVEPGRGRSVTMSVSASRGSSPERARVTVAWEAAAGTPGMVTDTADRVVVTANAITGQQLFQGTVARDANAARPAGQITFDAPAGMLNVRSVAESARGQRLESNELMFDVPDFSGTGPQLTSVDLFRGRTARDIQLVRTAEHPVPAVVRTFSRAERVLLRFGAYGPGGTTPAISMKLLSRAGTSMATLPAPVAGQNGMLEAEMALASFPPGDYLIEISAESDGTVVRKLLGIRVTG